ncbi:Hemolysin secretion protein D, chromosomal [Calidithermus roseus]|uniref:Hemolysin secretion protein D, chromosomal n=2 Tax=Calidithermus roseus TaxID=1644118 RepID=A0A399EUA7_9DEIN|nr:Hemolysin secretion protein D, chromosomal [Calidithermus roseus]
MTLDWENPHPRTARLTLWLMMAMVIAAIAWASLTQIQVYALVSGSLEPKGRLIEVTAPLSGRVTKVQLQRWGHVKAGELLAEIDSVGASAEETESQRQNLLAQVREKESALALARTDLIERRRIAVQQRLLWEGGATSRNAYEEATANLARAKRALEQITAQIAALRAQLEVLDVRRKVEIRAPVDGRVAQLEVRHPGVQVSTGQVLLQILPEGVPLVFRGYVLERERPKVRVGAEAEVAWNSYPRQKYGVSHGKVLGVSPTTTALEALRGQSVYEVEIGLDSLKIGEQTILPGMAGEARALATKKTALALFWDWVRGVNPWE